MSKEMIVLRLIHMVGGIIWVGGVFFMSFFLIPSLREAGPAGAPVMQGLMKRKIFVIMPVLGLIVMLVGFRMMQIVAGGFFTDYFWDSAGRWYAYSSVPVIIGFLIGVFVGRPAMLKSQALMASPDKDSRMPEIQALQAKSAGALRATAWLLLLGAVGMAMARYL
jgi:hypothetical protein